MKNTTKNNMPLITPVFLRDEDYDRESDAFMLGERILVCPIFDEGADEVQLFLPKSEKGFRLRGQGEIEQGGTFVMVHCGIHDLPVWFVEDE